MRNIIVSFLLLLSMGCGQQDKQNKSSPAKKETETGWKELNEPTYTVQYPTSWDLDTKKETNGGFLLLSPLEPGEDNFRENFNLIIQPTGENVDLDSYAAFSKKQVEDYLPHVVFIENKRIKNDQGEHHQ